MGWTGRANSENELDRIMKIEPEGVRDEGRPKLR
jgi:hypothetical protein